MLLTILTILHVLIAFALVGLILVQRGKGADAGAAFGSGASSTIFGARGSASFLSRATAILAIMFFSNTMALGYLTTAVSERKSLMDQPLFEVQDMKWEDTAKKSDADAKAKQAQHQGKAQTSSGVSTSAGSDPTPKAPSPAVPETPGGVSTAGEAGRPAETEPSDMPEIPE